MHKTKQVSKSDFLSYLECPYQFYHYCTHPKIKPSNSESDQLTVEIGMEFQNTVNDLLDDSFQKEVEFTTDKHYSRTDCVRYIDDNTVELYEIKSSKFKQGEKIDDKYIFDIAFQKFVAEEAGFKVVDSYLIMASYTYQFNGKKHTNELYEIVNVNEHVKAIEEEVKKLAEQAYEIESQLQKPTVKHECSLKTKCSYLSSIIDWSEYNIETLPGLRTDKFWPLIEQGVYSLDDIKGESQLTDKQLVYLKAYRDDEIVTNKTQIIEELNTLEFPLYFLDYETYAPAVPILTSYGPHERIPFQFSLHILDEEGTEPRHVEFLLENLDDQQKLINKLKTNIGPKGHLIAWYKSFEKGCNKILADKFPEHKDFLQDLNERFYDLRDIFAKGYYLDHRFKGSTSIKYVLPVLIPEMTYKNMSINEGQLASYRWKKAFVDEQSNYPKEKTKKELLEYCKQDSLAMVEIYKFLKSKV